MDSTFALLKEEINKTQESEHDLAKWKIVVTATLGAAAIGLNKDSDPNKAWLLLFIPFVCAYIDLYTYQYSLRILALAKFLREYPNGDAALRAYEQQCETLRKGKFFSLGRGAATASSIGLSLLGPGFFIVKRSTSTGIRNAASPLLSSANILIGSAWLCGVILIVGLNIYYQRKAKDFEAKDEPSSEKASQRETEHTPAA